MLPVTLAFPCSVKVHEARFSPPDEHTPDQMADRSLSTDRVDDIRSAGERTGAVLEVRVVAFLQSNEKVSKSAKDFLAMTRSV
jgi:biotin carboxylase